MFALHRDILARTAAVHPRQAPTYLYFAMACRCLLLQLHFRDDRLLEAIAQQAQRKAAILTPHDISQLASAYARLSFPHPQLLQLLNSQAVAKASGFAPWVLVHTAWALHVCGQDVGLLLREAVPLLQGRVGELKELDVSTLLWLMAGACMYAQARVDPDQPFYQHLGVSKPQPPHAGGGCALCMCWDLRVPSCGRGGYCNCLSHHLLPCNTSSVPLSTSRWCSAALALDILVCRCLPA